MMTRETTIIKLVEEAGRGLVSILAGLLAVAGGGWLVRYAVHSEPHSDKLLYLGLAIALGGVSIMPSILPKVKETFIFVQTLPVVGPMLGGRRSTDTQPPAGGGT